MSTRWRLRPFDLSCTEWVPVDRGVKLSIQRRVLSWEPDSGWGLVWAKLIECGVRDHLMHTLDIHDIAWILDNRASGHSDTRPPASDDNATANPEAADPTEAAIARLRGRDDSEEIFTLLIAIRREERTTKRPASMKVVWGKAFDSTAVWNVYSPLVKFLAGMGVLDSIQRVGYSLTELGNSIAERIEAERTEAEKERQKARQAIRVAKPA